MTLSAACYRPFFLLFVCTTLALLAVLGAEARGSDENQDPRTDHQWHFIEAENTSLQGASQSSGTAVWTYGGSAVWDVITTEGEYRLLMRVRAGYAGDHQSGVRDKTSYRATVDGRPVSLRFVPNTLVYSSDESNWAWIVGDVGRLEKGLHSIKFDSGWQFSRWDSFILTSDPSYTPEPELTNRKETATDLSLLDEEQLKQFQGFTVWPARAADNCSPDARPDDGRSATRLHLTACRNQHAVAAFNVTNWLDEPLLFRVYRPGPDSGPQSVPEEEIVLRYAVPLPAPRSTPLADALPQMDDAGTLLVPAHETRQVWIEMRTHALDARTHNARFRVQPLNAPGRCRTSDLELSLNVVDVVLPSQHPLDIFMCEYDLNRAGMSRDLPEHFVNMYHNCLIPFPGQKEPEFSAMDQAIQRELGYPGARSVFFEHWHFRSSRAWQEEANQAQWIAGIRAWSTHLRNTLDLGYDEFTLHIFDEVSGGGIDTFVQARELVRKADPQIRVTMTVTPQITLEEVRRLDPAVDVWCPHMELYESQAEVVAWLRRTGKPIMPYYCAENKRFWSPDFYRRWSWHLFDQEVDGLFMWTYLSRDAWQGRAWDGGVVFAGNRQIVPSRRWELMRMGLQDWLLLDMASKSGHAEQVGQLVRGVLAQKEGGPTMAAARAQLLELLAPR